MSLVKWRHLGAFVLAATFFLLLMAYYPQSINTVNLEELIGSNEHNLFFIETNDNISALHPRLLCAFESAAAHNPSLKVEVQFDINVFTQPIVRVFED